MTLIMDGLLRTRSQILLWGLMSIVAQSAFATILPPLPLLPLPSARQLKWQQRQQIMFFHFGLNTFTDVEWSTGRDDPKLFHPKHFDPQQWVKTAKAAGFSLVILTAKHHDGFCLWPSAYTNYSVKSSNWKNGQGDVVGDLARAAREEGVDLGLYLSPWDRHDPSYGRTQQYNEFYMAQLAELLTKYGPISEIWFDGAKGANAPAMKYMFKRWFGLTNELQSIANVFSNTGPDVRWVGDEAGAAGSTCWSMVNRSGINIASNNTDLQLLNTGDRYGKDWVPPECDVSIRTGWFWHKKERPKTVLDLLNIYYESVGRNCVLLLNVPPNSSGLLPVEDVRMLLQFKQAVDSIFSVNLAWNATVAATSSRGDPFGPANVLDDDISTYWAPAEGHDKGCKLKLKWESPVKFNVVRIQETIGMGQRVIRYHIKVWDGRKWHTFSNGTTIGYNKLDRSSKTTTRERATIGGGRRFADWKALRCELVIEEARAAPLIASFGLYMDMNEYN